MRKISIEKVGNGFILTTIAAHGFDATADLKSSSLVFESFGDMIKHIEPKLNTVGNPALERARAIMGLKGPAEAKPNDG